MSKNKNSLLVGKAWLMDYQNQLCNFLENNLVEFRMTFYCQETDNRNIINSRPLTDKERYGLYQEINNIQNRINFLNKLSDGKLD
tara:strand:+ start:219 stop:473 length:255 start_codon:yes stop_codon:yes gene_type:complete